MFSLLSSLTGDDAFRVRRAERVVHELSERRGLISAQPVLYDECVVAVVEVSGFVEEKAAVIFGTVVRVRDVLRVGVNRLHQRRAVVQPLDARRWISIYCEGEAPVMLLLRCLQGQDFGRDCRRDRDALHRSLYERL